MPPPAKQHAVCLRLYMLSIALLRGCPRGFASCLQDLHLILSLVATLLRNSPQLADALLGVTIDYNSGQKVDWVDIIVAALNVLPGLAGRAATELHNRATFTQEFAATTTTTASSGSGSSAGAFAWSVLNSLADCLAATAAAAACQPSRLLSALCSCNLFEGVSAAAEPLPLVALEDLGGWVQEQQAAGTAGSTSDWSSLGTLQVGPCRAPDPGLPLCSCVALACGPSAQCKEASMSQQSAAFACCGIFPVVHCCGCGVLLLPAGAAADAGGAPGPLPPDPGGGEPHDAAVGAAVHLGPCAQPGWVHSAQVRLGLRVKIWVQARRRPP